LDGNSQSVGLRQGRSAPFVAQRDLVGQIGSSQWLGAIRRVLGRSRVLVALVTPSEQMEHTVDVKRKRLHQNIACSSSRGGQQARISAQDKVDEILSEALVEPLGGRKPASY
jgi:hypothetical protein